MNNQYEVVDMFCGAGGTSTGVMLAAEALGIDINLMALNHWEVAIATHSKNHPETKHYNADLQDIDPREAVPSGKLRILVASPECTHFSRARGGKPRSKQSRASAKYILSWANKLDIEDILIENVPEFQEWGPLHRKHSKECKPDKLKGCSDKKCFFEKPIQSRKGEYFLRFVGKLKQLGYAVGWRVLNCADYGDPTTRKRLFVIARKLKPVRFPEATHHKHGGDMFGKLQAWRTARHDVIDWSVKGVSIFNRKKPLAENTLKRIWAGLIKFSGKAFMLGQQSGASPRDIDEPVPTVASDGAISFIEPYLIEYRGGDKSERRTVSVDAPLPTQDTSNRFGLCEPFILPFEGFYRGNQPRSVDEPMNAITSRGGGHLVQPFVIQMEQGGTLHHVDKPMPTITSADAFAVVDPFLVEYYGTGEACSIDEPMKTITAKDHFALVEPLVFMHQGRKYLLDIRFRMLLPSELARAMSFPADYEFIGTREQVVKQIGNAVPIYTAMALAMVLFG